MTNLDPSKLVERRANVADVDNYNNAQSGPYHDRNHWLYDYDYHTTFVKWATAWVWQYTVRVEEKCTEKCDGGFCTFAETFRRVLASNERTELYETYYYGIDAVERAGTIVHEVRHADGRYSHVSGCPAGGSCDTRWTDAGANTYEMLWLAAFYWFGKDNYNSYIHPARQAAALDEFNSTLFGKFVEPVLWDIYQLRLINNNVQYFLEVARCSEDPSNPTPCF